MPVKAERGGGPPDGPEFGSGIRGCYAYAGWKSRTAQFPHQRGRGGEEFPETLIEDAPRRREFPVTTKDSSARPIRSGRLGVGLQVAGGWQPAPVAGLGGGSGRARAGAGFGGRERVEKQVMTDSGTECRIESILRIRVRTEILRVRLAGLLGSED
jgi:hypothetical protein